MKRWAIVALAIWTTGATAADSPLRLEDVLTTSSSHFPKILEGFARQRIAAGEQEAALGAFDLVFSADSFSRATGFYDGNAIGGKATQPLRSMGADVYGQYRISTGDFPIYEDGNFTNRGGQAKIGILFSLLRDRDIDQRRFAQSDAQYALRDADFELLLTQIGVQQKASVSYWKWVAAGEALRIYEELLLNAEQRDEGLRKQLEQGAIARIFLTENQQNITRRRSFVTGAQRDFDKAANTLAFYYRDTDGQPLLAKRTQLPSELPLASTAALPGLTDAARIEDTLARRPEVRQLRNAIERANNRMQLKENALRPTFDMRVELAQGLGGVGEGGISRDSTDTTIGVQFSVPLQRRAARARLNQARNELDALQLQQQQIEEQIEIEVRDIVLTLRYAAELATLAQQEVSQSQELAVAEQRRFDSGASDFFLVNVREQSVANVKVRAIAARLDTQVARANLDAATIDLTRLGLTAPAIP